MSGHDKLGHAHCTVLMCDISGKSVNYVCSPIFFFILVISRHLPVISSLTVIVLLMLGCGKGLVKKFHANVFKMGYGLKSGMWNSGMWLPGCRCQGSYLFQSLQNVKGITWQGGSKNVGT